MTQMQDDILEGLTDSQTEAVTHLGGPMLVVAGAGSGKTRVVTRRIAYLISKGVWPSSILAMTFTNKAASVMRERILSLVGEVPRNLGTFHSCCARFLRKDIGRLNDSWTSDFSIYDENEQLSLMKHTLKGLPDGILAGFSPAELLHLISKAKNDRMDIRNYLNINYLHIDVDAVALVADAYAAALKQMNALDFDDLLLLVIRLLEEDPMTRELYHNRLRYILIDEYQDTNQAQYELMKLLVGPERNIHVTGDPDQCIYSWRGSHYRNIMNFTQDYPDARVVRLEQNYRSTQTILDVANELIRKNAQRIDKSLFSDKGYGDPILVVQTNNALEEATWIMRQAKKLIHNGFCLNDMAVFYRTNSQSRVLEKVFIEHHFPYRLVGGIPFYSRKEVKDILAFLRIKNNPNDTVAFRRMVSCLNCGVGEKSLDGLEQTAVANGQPLFTLLCRPDLPKLLSGRKPKILKLAEWCRQLQAIPAENLVDLVQEVLRLSDLQENYRREALLASRRGKVKRDEPSAEERLANIDAFLASVRQFADENPSASLADFLADASLMTDAQADDDQEDRITLMTLHSSKGQEFPYVFIVGVAEGMLPHANSATDEEGLEEERRLFYVGITRAKVGLTLLCPKSIYTWQGNMPCLPSRFLKELPLEHDGVTLCVARACSATPSYYSHRRY